MKITFPENSPFLENDLRANRWAIPYNYETLNARVENLIIKNEKAIRDKKILDLGSHFGTFSYASLQNKASFVEGIDAEKKLIEQGQQLFTEHQVPKKKYNFSNQEIISFLEKSPAKSFDTILCLGIFYYILDSFHFLNLMIRTARKYIILDTFTAYYGACITKEGTQIFSNTQEKTFDLPLILYPFTKAKKKDYSLQKNLVTDKISITPLSLPTVSTLERFFQILNLKYNLISWEKYVVNDLHWSDFTSEQIKKKSHWADLYHTQIRVSYLLKV